MVTGVAAAALVSSILFQQRTRVIEGTWIDLFEQSSFFEDESITSACGPDFNNAPHFAYYPERGSAEHRFVEANRKRLEEGGGVLVSENGVWPVTAYSVKFVGRHQLLGFGFGHLGSHASEYVVERLVSIEPVALVECDIRPS